MLVAPGMWSCANSSWPRTSTSWAPSFSRRLTSAAEKTWDGISLMYSASPDAHRRKPQGDVHHDQVARRFSPNRQLRLVKDPGGIPRRQAIAAHRDRAFDQVKIARPIGSESVHDFRAGAQGRHENSGVLVDRDHVAARSPDDFQKRVRPLRPCELSLLERGGQVSGVGEDPELKKLHRLGL